VHYPCCERGGAIPLIMQLLLQYYLPEQTPRDRNHGSHSHEVPEFSDCQLRGVAGCTTSYGRKEKVQYQCTTVIPL
jgi:hypothetical protein